MRLVAIKGPEPKRVSPKRETEIYTLLERYPGLFEKGTLFRLLSVNVRTEKGPDFIAVNHKGHLIIGEIKRGVSRHSVDMGMRGSRSVTCMRTSEL